MNIWGIHISNTLLGWIAFLSVSTGFILVPSTIAWKIKKRMKDHPIPERNHVVAVFCESRVSGRSHKSWFTRLSAAYKCLHVMVTDDELWVFLPDLLGWMAVQTDLDHRIPLKAVLNIDRTRKSLILTYKNDQNETKKIELRLRNPDLFLRAIEQAA